MEPENLFGHFMCLIGERSCSTWKDERGVEHAKLTLEGRSTQCYEWAHLYETSKPSLAEELRYQARTYARMRQDELDKEARDARA